MVKKKADSESNYCIIITSATVKMALLLNENKGDYSPEVEYERRAS